MPTALRSGLPLLGSSFHHLHRLLQDSIKHQGTTKHHFLKTLISGFFFFFPNSKSRHKDVADHLSQRSADYTLWPNLLLNKF